jgi:hypothetical protein
MNRDGELNVADWFDDPFKKCVCGAPMYKHIYVMPDNRFVCPCEFGIPVREDAEGDAHLQLDWAVVDKEPGESK